MATSAASLRRHVRPVRVALVGAASLAGSLWAFHASWAADEVTTTYMVEVVAWLVLGLSASALLAWAATWATWSAMRAKAVLLVGVPVAAGVIGLLLLVYALAIVHDIQSD